MASPASRNSQVLLIDRANVLAVGPGLGQRAWGHALWRTAIAAAKALVLDADGLNLLAREPLALPKQCVLTPHPGEAARLLGVDTAAITADRFAAVRELAQRHQSVVVLKGAGTLISSAHGEVSICPWGNPGMASGGTGDVLTGVIAGLLAQGFDAWHAAQAGRRAACAGRGCSGASRRGGLDCKRSVGAVTAPAQRSLHMIVAATSKQIVDEPRLVAIAQQLARSVGTGGVIHLRGDLGAGKTTFARALLRELGVGERIKSPTYSLVESYLARRPGDPSSRFVPHR